MKNINNRTGRKTNSSKPWAPKPEVQKKQKSPYNYGGDTSAYKTAPNVKIPANARKTKNGKTFMQNLEQTWDNTYNYANLTRTENGAWGYKSTGNKLLDLNFAVASLRGKTDKEIYTKFREAFNEYPIYAMRWLAYASDVREGLGERNLFRVCIVDLAKNGQHELVKKIIPMIPEYSRWDNLWPLLNVKATSTAVLKLVKSQMTKDNANYLAGKSVSLMAKWLPSENTSSAQTRKYADIIMKYLKMSPKQYRQWLSKMRKYIDVVERKMSSDNWQAIDYEAVPSRANLIYNKAFLKHDYERRNAYLSALTKGEAKINSSVAFPHDIVHKYNGGYYGCPTKLDPALEAMWKSLPDMVKGNGNTLVVADGSGSMDCPVGGTRVTARNVADALAIYFAERCSGDFKNKYITFSSRPQLVNLGNGSLMSKLQTAHQHNEVANTNIEAVFNLILQTAIENDMSQDELPQNILIISDQEFDTCAEMGPVRTSSYWGGGQRVNKTLFQTMAQRYEAEGYKLPRLVFWNVNSRTGTIPVKQNDMGVALVSGFSVNICKMVMSGKTDPFDCLLEAINVPRYDVVEQAVVEVMENRGL